MTKMRIAMLYYNNPPFNLHTHEEVGLGGSESGFTATVKRLADLGHDVFVFNRYEPFVDYGKIKWRNIAAFNPAEYYDVVYSLRHMEPFRQKLNTKLKVLFLADTECKGLGAEVAAGRIDLIMSVSHWQKEKIALEEEVADKYWYVASNGVEDRPVSDNKAFAECLFTSTVERGLSSLLEVWSRIKAQVQEAKLELYCSFLGWGVSAEENNQMMGDWYRRIDSMHDLGVTNHKHVNAAGMLAAQQRADLYLYPSDYRETCCMSVLESMMSGTIPVVTGRAGLLEKVIPGVMGAVVPAYGVDTKRYQDIFVEKTVALLRLGPEDRNRIRQNCRAYASNFTYDKLVKQWSDEWQSRISS